MSHHFVLVVIAMVAKARPAKWLDKLISKIALSIVIVASVNLPLLQVLVSRVELRS